MHNIFKIILQFCSYLVALVIFSHFELDVLVSVVEGFECPILLHIPLSCYALDDYWLSGLLIFINEAFNSQLININSIDLVGAAEQLLSGIRPEKSFLVPLLPF